MYIIADNKNFYT